MSSEEHTPPPGPPTGVPGETNVLLGFERFLSEISAKFVRATGSEVEPLVLEGLRQFALYLAVERFTLTEVLPEVKQTHVRFSYAGEGLPPISPQRADQLFPWTTRQLLDNKVVTLYYPFSFPPEAEEDRRNAELGKFKSSIHIPIVVDGTVRFFISAAALSEERIWPDLLIPRIRLLGEVMANALLRKQRDAEIRMLKESLEIENRSLQEVATNREEYADIIGTSDALRYVQYRMGQVAPTDATVLLLGETGVGKELFARAIHRLSKRKDRPLLKVDCASLTPSLIESELFGHERGAFTGAVGMRKGRFELASGGTVFLDEVGELPLELQAKLLRVLEDGCIERVGGARHVAVNVRVIAATNRDLEREMRSGGFRRDLFYRLNTFPLTVPPLRDRRGDIPPLVEHFVRVYGTRYTRPVLGIPPEVMAALTRYRWPGNIRELENVIESAVIVSPGPMLQIPLLEAPPGAEPEKRPLRSLAEVERAHILSVLEETLWRIEGPKGAAVILGLHPDTLRYRMKKLEIRRPTPSAK
jgi:formate hydrogenlyase transcriptional activator